MNEGYGCHSNFVPLVIECGTNVAVDNKTAIPTMRRNYEFDTSGWMCECEVDESDENASQSDNWVLVFEGNGILNHRPFK